MTMVGPTWRDAKIATLHARYAELLRLREELLHLRDHVQRLERSRHDTNLRMAAVSGQPLY